MAKKMATSRSQLDRVLDPSDVSVQLVTLIKAARALGKEIEIKIKRATKIEVRTKGSWVQVLPGSPIFNELRAASEAVSRSAGPFVHSTDAPALARSRTVHVS
jgi:hypothetical protein